MAVNSDLIQRLYMTTKKRVKAGYEKKNYSTSYLFHVITNNCAQLQVRVP